MNESYDSRAKNASHDQSRNSAVLAHEKGKHGKDDKGEEGLPRENLKEAFNHARRLLIDGQIQQASENCMKALKDANQLFGENSAESLPGYFILAEANIQEGKLKRAEDFLIGAYWNLLKHSQDEKQAAGNNANLNQKNEILEEKDYMIYKGTLHKVFAKLYSAKKEYDRALDELKNGIFIDSCEYGPEDVQTSLSYFHLGEIFIKMDEPEKGYSFYNQAIKIWYRTFKILMKNNADDSEVDEIIIKQGHSLLKEAEALFTERIKMEGEQEVIDDFYKLNYALAFMHKYVGEEELAMEYCQNIEGYLLRKFDQNHPKLRRFYDFFPNYQRNAPMEGDEDLEQNEESEQNEEYVGQNEEYGGQNEEYGGQNEEAEDSNNQMSYS